MCNFIYFIFFKSFNHFFLVCSITSDLVIPVLLFFALTDQKYYSVEEAVESIGFGRFHILLFVIMGSANVRALFVCFCMV